MRNCPGLEIMDGVRLTQPSRKLRRWMGTHGRKTRERTIDVAEHRLQRSGRLAIGITRLRWPGHLRKRPMSLAHHDTVMASVPDRKNE